MISAIYLNPIGSASDLQRVEAGKITVFIGPNSGGKSLALREIQGLATHATAGTGEVIKRLDLDVLPVDFLLEVLEREFELLPVTNGTDFPPRHRHRTRHETVSLDVLKEAFRAPNVSEHRYMILNYLGRDLCTALNGSDRLNLLADDLIGDMKVQPGTPFQKLHRDNSKRAKFRQSLFDSFGTYPVFDTTNGSKIHMRWAPVPPPDDDVERSQTDRALSFFQSLPPERETGDGIRAYAGILAAVMAENYTTLVVDEPEAFLHPTIAFALGKQIGEHIAETPQKVFFATHSAQFLLGCIQSGQPVTVVRVTYDGERGSARCLSTEDVRTILRTPLLRSLGVANALFARFAVVTEADADRVFYQEINERLLSVKDPRGIPDCVFLNGNGKDSMAIIVSLLRKVGIPAAPIYDLDALLRHGDVPKRISESSYMSPDTAQKFLSERQAVLAPFDDNGKALKEHGINCPGLNADGIQRLIATTKQHGAFLVPVGELENWLPGTVARLPKSKWCSRMLAALSVSAGGDNSLSPTAGDVWDFMGDIRTWLTDSMRDGLP